jgi:hypothetical protein
MKKLFLLLLVASIGLTDAVAQSQLRVHLADNSRISVAVNGRRFNTRGTSVTVGDLPPGRHSLRIFALTYDRWGRSYDRIVYQGSVVTSYLMATHFVYDRYSRRVDVRNISLDGAYSSLSSGQHPDNSQYRMNYDDGSDRNANINSYEKYDKNQPAVTDDENKVNPSQSGPVASPVPTGSFDDAESEKLKSKVDAKGTDTEKLKLIKESLKRETITTFQVSYIMDWFLFESTKVEFAKWAYTITTDKDFYNDISAKFNYKSSKEELDTFLQNRR